jgi:hypothetical protein
MARHAATRRLCQCPLAGVRGLRRRPAPCAAAGLSGLSWPGSGEGPGHLLRYMR